MLRKLIRHEFRATRRVMWPVFAGMLALSLLVRWMIYLDEYRSYALPAVFDWFYTILIICFVLGIFALCFAPLVVSALRFERHILGDEGYLTLTLPVSFHKILLSKLLVSAVWYALAFLMLVLVCLLAALSANDWAEIIKALPTLCGALFEQKAVPVSTLVLYGIELLLNAVCAVTVLSLLVYAAYAVGFSFRRHRSALTGVCMPGFVVLSSWAMIAVPVKLLDLGSMSWAQLTGLQTLHLVLLTFLLVEVLVGAVWYAVTWYFATHRLNLE